MANKEYRKMKVYDQSGYHYKSTPTIMMKGAWLSELGFEANTPIVVHCEDGILTITRADAMNYDDVPDSELIAVAESKTKYGKS